MLKERFTKSLLFILLVLLASIMLFQQLHAETISGVASVIDGDTIVIHRRHIRLNGIDAPEHNQSCETSSGKRWRCGQKAAFTLADEIGHAVVMCRGNHDGPYRRLIADCFKGPENLNAFMVRQGMAVAYRHYSKKYVPEEEQARAAQRGIWSGHFVMPWRWRRGVRLR